MLVARWLAVSLLVAGVVLSASMCQAGQSPAPQPAPVPDNGSIVTATVLKYSIWNSKLLQTQMEIEPGLTVYSVELNVLTSERANEQVENLVKPGDTIEVFSRNALSPDLFGKDVKASVQLIGDIRQAQYWVSKVETLSK